MLVMNTIVRVWFVLCGVYLNVSMFNLIAIVLGFGTSAAVVYTLIWLAYAALLFSPFGDKWLDLSIGTRAPTRVEAELMEETDGELRERAKAFGEKYPKTLRLRVITDLYPNAMAFGARTVGLTSGLLKEASEEEIRGVFAHEVGHIVRKDTVFNLLVIAAFGPVLWLGVIGIRIASAFGVYGFLVLLIPFSVPFFAVFMHWIFSYILSFTGRSIEYAADEYAIRISRDEGLLSFLEKIEHLDVGPNGGFLAAYKASHPPTALREDRARIVLEDLSQEALNGLS